MKSKTTALILSIFLGGFGIDRFYLGYIGMGVFKLLTCGCFGILWIIDIVNIATGKLGPADGTSYDDVVVTSKSVSVKQLAKNPYEELEKIAKLYEQGVLNEEEFKKMKTKLLEEM